MKISNKNSEHCSSGSIEYAQRPKWIVIFRTSHGLTFHNFYFLHRLHLIRPLRTAISPRNVKVNCINAASGFSIESRNKLSSTKDERVHNKLCMRRASYPFTAISQCMNIVPWPNRPKWIVSNDKRRDNDKLILTLMQAPPALTFLFDDERERECGRSYVYVSIFDALKLVSDGTPENAQSIGKWNPFNLCDERDEKNVLKWLKMAVTRRTAVARGGWRWKEWHIKH